MANILVIDDDEEMRELLKMMLMDEHHDVTTAENGLKAMRFYHNQKFDLIITDIIMPDKDGFEVIFDIFESGIDTPIIAMSGGRRSITSEFGLNSATVMGVQATLHKPFTELQLNEAIKWILG